MTAVRRGFDLAQIRTPRRDRARLPLAAAARTRASTAATGAATLLAEMQRGGRPLPAAASLRRQGRGRRERHAARSSSYAAALEAVARRPGRARPRDPLPRAEDAARTRGRKDDWDDPAALRRVEGAPQATCATHIDAAKEALRTEAHRRAASRSRRSSSREYEAARKAEGVADFDDLLEWARDLLAESPEARAYFRRRFPVLLVDEFQDTDPVQAEIALCIASDDEPGDDWLELAPAAGQPHRRRRPEAVDLPLPAGRHRRLRLGAARPARRRRGAARPELPLGRRRPRLREHASSTGCSSSRRASSPANTHARGRRRRARRRVALGLRRPRRAERTTSADGIRTEEARLLATTIRHAIEDGWRVRDRDTGDERAATYGDVVVLLPRRTALDIYLDAFRRADVPVRAEGGRSFFQRQEVRDLANLLQAIDDPLDQIALVASLRSTCFGCTDEEIYLHHAAGNRLDYRLDPVDSPESVAEALALLRDLHDLRSRVSLAQLVRATLERTRLVEIALAGWDGQQSAANLVKLADQARAFSASGAGGLRALRALARRAARLLGRGRGERRRGDRRGRARDDDPRGEGARVPDRRPREPRRAAAQPTSSPCPTGARTACTCASRTATTSSRRPASTTPGSASRSRRRPRSKRLLYVAVTRARDHLVIPLASRPDKPDRMLFDLLPFAARVGSRARRHARSTAATSSTATTLPALPDDEPPLRSDAREEEVDAALAERDGVGARARGDDRRRGARRARSAPGDGGRGRRTRCRRRSSARATSR